MIQRTRSSAAVRICLLLAAAAGAAAARPKPQPTATPASPAAPAVPSASATPLPAEAAAAHLVPKAHPLSTYTLEGRFEITTHDVTFEAPAAYKEGFDFWSGYMRGQRKSEVYEIVTTTQDTDDNGNVPFRRTIPKFDMELERRGQILAPPDTLRQLLATEIYEGTLDPHGNARQVRRVAGSDDPQLETLALPEVLALFPEMGGTVDLKPGESIHEERVVALPTELSVAGLEHLTLKVTRDFILKTAVGGLSTFDVKVTYADDPAFKSKAERTTCRVGGGGTGEAEFDQPRGVFQRARIPTLLKLDIEAPLRPLPNHPEIDPSTLGKSHIELQFLVTGNQVVRRIWGEDAN